MKRHIVCLDGTWNDDRAGVSPTNVAKLHRVIAASDADGTVQISTYVSGIASTEGERLSFLKGAVGYGVGSNIRKAYAMLAEAYAAGDEIYLFGFSRGAFEARSLASLIDLVGLPKPSGFSDADAWDVYTCTERKRDPQRLSALRAAAHYPVRIRCLGVWDTVGNIGNPFFSSTPLSRRASFHDLSLHDTVDVALHALSIDEQRGTFKPTLWTRPAEQTPPAGQLVEQAWFSGTHADVGGGWRETGLSDIALIWMARRASEATGLAIDWQQLAASTRPDPLGPQHDSLAGKIFRLGRLIPFIRPIGQSEKAIPRWRRSLLGTWRTGLLARSDVTVNETIHESATARFGQKVIVLADGRSRMITYRPGSLAAVTGDETPDKAVQDPTKPRRVKIFTVHGTFAYETDWDNWVPPSAAAEKTTEQPFINRLSDELAIRGITLDQADHSQFNWSGGNSHDERRTAAIGLKKHIEAVLAEDRAKHGDGHYDGVYVVGHSHGGTISRLAMNLWDKDYNYYDPSVSDSHDEFKHDDTCDTCKRARNGKVGPSNERRPDGIITFGSPFVTFAKRPRGLISARLAAWSFRALVAVPLAAILMLAYMLGPFSIVSGAWQFLPGVLQTAMTLLAPLLLYWLIGRTAQFVVLALEGWAGKTTIVYAVNAVLQALKYATLIAAALYYYLYATDRLGMVNSWVPLTSERSQTWLGWIVLSALTAALLVNIPGAFLSWLRRDVAPLADRLPKKYDPPEDHAVQYVNYHTPGDEAGLGLRFFMGLTWMTQTMAVAAVAVLVFGFILMVLSAIEAGLGYAEAGSLLSSANLSPASNFPEERDRIIALIDRLTALPRAVWSDLFGASWLPALGDLENRREVVWYVPFAIAFATLVIFVVLMPLVAVAVTAVYLASVWLRGSGLVFGSEKLSWTIANAINVNRLANANSSLRLVNLAPTAWWRREVAHCYYYRSPQVIGDVAATIAGWQSHEPTKALGTGHYVSAAGRAVVVALFALSIFAVSIPVAQTLVSGMSAFGALTGAPDWAKSGPGSLPDPKTAAEFGQRGLMFSAIKQHDRALTDLDRAIALEPKTAEHYQHRARAYRRMNKNDLAFADYSKAIELEPKAAIYRYGRAAILRADGAFDAAVDEYDQAIALDPANASAYTSRGTTLIAKGEIARALADYSKALELAPGSSRVLMVFAGARYGSGDFAGAASLLSGKVDDQDPMSAYIAIYRYLAQRRLGERTGTLPASEIGEAIPKTWPYPVIEFLSGRKSEKQLRAAAKSADQTCEAAYYIGQWQMLQGDIVEGAKSLQAAASSCPIDFVERTAAVAELTRIGQR